MQQEKHGLVEDLMLTTLNDRWSMSKHSHYLAAAIQLPDISLLFFPCNTADVTLIHPSSPEPQKIQPARLRQIWPLHQGVSELISKTSHATHSSIADLYGMLSTFCLPPDVSHAPDGLDCCDLRVPLLGSSCPLGSSPHASDLERYVLVSSCC